MIVSENKNEPHVSKFTVRELIPGEHGERQLIERDANYTLTHLDGIPVLGKPVCISVRDEGQGPGLVYIDGNWPLYETWVYLSTGTDSSVLVAHFPGYRVVKNRRRRP